MMTFCLLCWADTPLDDRVFVSGSGQFAVCLTCYRRELDRMKKGRS